MVNAVADLYFFRLDFQGSITLFWLTVTLALASSRLVLERAPARRSEAESTLVKGVGCTAKIAGVKQSIRDA
jgi:hypothetical protein